MNTHTSNIKLLYQKATEYHRIGNFKDAIVLYTQILTISPLHFKSHFKLASLYEKGYEINSRKELLHNEGDERLFTKAFTHYEKAAELGYEVAQFNLGVMLMTGKGVPKNEEQAIKWLRIASENGSKRAGVVLEKIIENRSNDISKYTSRSPSLISQSSDRGNNSPHYRESISPNSERNDISPRFRDTKKIVNYSPSSDSISTKLSSDEFSKNRKEYSPINISNDESKNRNARSSYHKHSDPESDSEYHQYLDRYVSNNNGELDYSEKRKSSTFRDTSDDDLSPKRVVSFEDDSENEFLNQRASFQKSLSPSRVDNQILSPPELRSPLNISTSPRILQNIKSSPSLPSSTYGSPTIKMNRSNSGLSNLNSSSPRNKDTPVSPRLSSKDKLNESRGSESKSLNSSGHLSPRSISKHFSTESLLDIQNLENKLNDAKKDLKEKTTNMKLLEAEKKREEKKMKKKDERILKLDTKIKLLEKRIQEKDKLVEQTLKNSKQDFQKLVEEYEARIQEKEIHILALENENTLLQKEVEKHIIDIKNSYEVKLEEMSDEIDELKRKLQQSAMIVKSLESNIEHQQFESSKRLNTQKSKYFSEYEETKEELKLEIERLKLEISDMKKYQEIEIQSFMDEKKSMNESFMFKKKEYAEKIDNLMEDLRNQKQKQIHEVRQREAQLKTTFDAERRQLMDENQKIKNEVNIIIEDKLDEERRKFQSGYDTLLNKHREEIATLEIDHKQEISKLKDKIQALQLEMLSIKNNDSMANKIVEQERTINDFKAKEGESQRMISNLSRQNAAFRETIQQNTENEKIIQEKLESQEIKLKVYEDKCRKLEAHVEHLRSEASSLPTQNDVETIKLQTEKLQGIIIQQFDKIELQKNEISKLESLNKTLESQIKVLTQDYEKKIKQLSQINDMNGLKHLKNSESRDKNSPNSSKRFVEPFSSILDEGEGRSKTFEDEFNQMVQIIQKQRNGGKIESQWQNILDRLNTLKREYNLNIKQHQNQIHDVIQYCMSIRE